MKPGNRKAVIAALGANIGVAAGKLAVFSATGSASMLAESVHSLADSTNQALLLFGGRSAKRAPTREHPFGYGRERFFWAFVVALVIFSLGGLFAIYEGTHKFLDPHPLNRPWLAIGLLVFASALEGFALHTAVKEARKERGKSSWLAFIRHTKNPELPVILLEDLGALLGLVFAGVGIGLAMVTGDARYDALGSIAIGILLGGIAFVLAVEMRSLLIGEAASPAQRRAIVEAIESSECVSRLIHLKTQHLGPDELLVAAKVEFADGQSLSDLARSIDLVETRMREAAPIRQLIYLEPDLYRATTEEAGGDPSSSARPSRSSGADTPS